MPVATKKLDAHTVKVQTASVELQMVTVNAKKMTQSVFRQIPYEPLIQIKRDDDENVIIIEGQGTPWGWINYYWKDAYPGDHHHSYNSDYDAIRHIIDCRKHFIWQKGTDLRRWVGWTIPEDLLESDDISGELLLMPFDVYGFVFTRGRALRDGSSDFINIFNELMD